jgi:hypothetical protein
MTKSEWIESLKSLIEHPTEKRIAMWAAKIDREVKQAEHDAFMEAKNMMQQSLNHMKWDI